MGSRRTAGTCAVPAARSLGAGKGTTESDSELAPHAHMVAKSIHEIKSFPPGDSRRAHLAPAVYVQLKATWNVELNCRQDSREQPAQNPQPDPSRSDPAEPRSDRACRLSKRQKRSATHKKNLRKRSTKTQRGVMKMGAPIYE